MAQRDNILSFKPNERRVALDEKARQSVAECRQVLERTLPTLIKAMFEKLDDALYELSERSGASSIQTAYFDVMRMVRKQRPYMEQNFLRGVFGDFDQLWIRGPRCLVADDRPPVGNDVDDLTLVDEAELEDALAINNLVSKTESRHQRELFALNQRLGHLLGGQDVDNQSNPVGPAAVCQHFREGLRDLTVDPPIRLVIYKLFDKEVTTPMGGLYEELNALLSRAGILSKPTVRYGSGGTAAGRAGPRQGSQAMPVGRAAQDVGEGTQDPGEAMADLFPQLQGLISGYRVNAGLAPSVPSAPLANLPVVDTAELLGALSLMQQAAMAYRPAESSAERLGPVELREQLTQTLSLREQGKANRLLGQADQDTLDVIAMLFEFMLDDPTLPDAMKALIARLQIPMVKVAILDKSFFSRKQHPARRLLNALAQAAVGWTDDGDRSPNGLYGRMEATVARITNDFVDDLSLFEELHEEFSRYLERERRGAELAEERTQQVTRGKEQLRVAKDVVADELERRLDASPAVPPVVRELLMEAWLDVLLLTYLRQGPDSATWQEQLRLADRLLWSVQPKREYEERHELLRDIPELLRGLREGLTGISFDQHRSARLFKDLQSCHIASLRGPGAEQRPQEAPGASRQPPAAPRPAPVVAAAPAPVPGRTPGQAPDQPPEPEVAPPVQVSAMGSPKPGAQSGGGQAVAEERDAYWEQAASLPVGTWLEMREADGKQVRIKLSWKSEVTDTHVFVNRKGIKVLEITLPGVAMLLRRGTAEVLKDLNTPIMERAMGAMVKALKQTDSEASA